MKKIFIHLLILSLFTAQGFSNEATPIERLKRNPGIYLNFQDVPIFHTGNPLEGLNAFTVIPPCSIQSPEVNKKVRAVIEQELGSIGTVIKDDISGFGTGNILNIQIGPVSKWDGGELPIFRVTLNIETPVVISKTNVKSLPRVWTVNNFVDAPLNIKSEEKSIEAMQKLLGEFVKNYKFSNPDQTKRPTFYLMS